ncbi:RNA-directed DNA polymerase [Raphanus sativus]|nr:RNA-directed DNA polymerase [Raphanus sativus]
MDSALRRRRSADSRSKQPAVSKDPVRDAPSRDSRDNHRLGKVTSNNSTITFSPYENVELDMPHDDALIITIDLVGVSFSKVLVDSGCVANLLSHDTFEKISRPDLAINKYAPPPSTPLEVEAGYPYQETW